MEGGNALLRTGMPICPDTGCLGAWGAAAGQVVLKYLVTDAPTALWAGTFLFLIRRFPFYGRAHGTCPAVEELYSTQAASSRIGSRHRAMPHPHLQGTQNVI